MEKVQTRIEVLWVLNDFQKQLCVVEERTADLAVGRDGLISQIALNRAKAQTELAYLNVYLTSNPDAPAELHANINKVIEATKWMFEERGAKSSSPVPPPKLPAPQEARGQWHAYADRDFAQLERHRATSCGPHSPFTALIAKQPKEAKMEPTAENLANIESWRKYFGSTPSKLQL